MSSLNFLADYRETSKDFFKNYFREKKKEARKIDPLILEAIKNLEEYIHGGKKVRGALTVLGYKAAGGEKEKEIIPVSAAAEIIHSSLLIHDDFIDRDGVRRGKPTLHKIYADKESKHYGDSIAIIIGDLGFYLGHKLVAESNFTPAKKIRSLVTLDSLLINTGYGQVLDITLDKKENLEWEDIFKVRKLKTADYTFALPLKIGAILAGADKKVLGAIKKYGEPVGIAFQIKDDILGVFGDPKVTGKSNESDIKEGKKTFLFAKAAEMSAKKGKDYLEKWYGSEKLDKKKTEKIREIIRESGALGYSEELARKLVKEGKESVSQITKNKKYQKTLAQLADYMVERKK